MLKVLRCKDLHLKTGGGISSGYFAEGLIMIGGLDMEGRCICEIGARWTSVPIDRILVL
jgi:hypothetical protein